MSRGLGSPPQCTRTPPTSGDPSGQAYLYNAPGPSVHSASGQTFEGLGLELLLRARGTLHALMDRQRRVSSTR